MSVALLPAISYPGSSVTVSNSKKQEFLHSENYISASLMENDVGLCDEQSMFIIHTHYMCFLFWHSPHHSHVSSTQHKNIFVMWLNILGAFSYFPFKHTHTHTQTQSSNVMELLKHKCLIKKQKYIGRQQTADMGEKNHPHAIYWPFLHVNAKFLMRSWMALY